MKERDKTLGLPVEDVQAAMQEENCLKCYGCSHATVMAAQIAYRSSAHLKLTYDTLVEDPVEDAKFEEDIAEKRKELKNFTENCNGYSEVKREQGRPAKMCDSPESPDTRISVIAGRILEFFRSQ